MKQSFGFTLITILLQIQINLTSVSKYYNFSIQPSQTVNRTKVIPAIK